MARLTVSPVSAANVRSGPRASSGSRKVRRSGATRRAIPMPSRNRFVTGSRARNDRSRSVGSECAQRPSGEFWQPESTEERRDQARDPDAKPEPFRDRVASEERPLQKRGGNAVSRWLRPVLQIRDLRERKLSPLSGK